MRAFSLFVFLVTFLLPLPSRADWPPNYEKWPQTGYPPDREGKDEDQPPASPKNPPPPPSPVEEKAALLTLATMLVCAAGAIRRPSSGRSLARSPSISLRAPTP